MIDALDSSTPPTDAQVQQAKAAGYGGWWGYIATKPGVNLLNPWALADFDRVRVLCPQPVAFCSGLDDPVALRSLAAQWNVRLCLDDEAGIRPPGGWEQAWLDASGAGLYGNCSVHGLGAAFHVLSWYGVGSGVWYSGCLRPAGPVGWQWQGSHQEFGLDVDRGTYDDWFGGDMTPEQAAQLDWLFTQWHAGTDPANKTLRDYYGDIYNTGIDTNAVVREIHSAPPPVATVDVNALAAALAPLLPSETDPKVIAQATLDAIKAQWAK